MTQPKAAAVASAIITAGFAATAHPKNDGSGDWLVRANAPDFSVDIATAHNLAVTQNIVGKIAEVEYS